MRFLRTIGMRNYLCPLQAISSWTWLESLNLLKIFGDNLQIYGKLRISFRVLQVVGSDRIRSNCLTENGSTQMSQYLQLN
jgi:hypothetical protein